jgi:hypothetical protein
MFKWLRVVKSFGPGTGKNGRFANPQLYELVTDVLGLGPYIPWSHVAWVLCAKTRVLEAVYGTVMLFVRVHAFPTTDMPNIVACGVLNG